VPSSVKKMQDTTNVPGDAALSLAAEERPPPVIHDDETEDIKNSKAARPSQSEGLRRRWPAGTYRGHCGDCGAETKGEALAEPIICLACGKDCLKTGGQPARQPYGAISRANRDHSSPPGPPLCNGCRGHAALPEGTISCAGCSGSFCFSCAGNWRAEPDQSRRPDFGPRTCNCGGVHLCFECRESTEDDDGDYNGWRCTIMDDDLGQEEGPCRNAICAASCRSTKDLSLSGEWVLAEDDRAEILEYTQYPSDAQQPQRCSDCGNAVCGKHSGIVQFDNRLLYNGDDELREHSDTLEWTDTEHWQSKHVSHWQVKCAGREDCHTYKCGSCWLDDLDKRELCEGDFHEQEASSRRWGSRWSKAGFCPICLDNPVCQACVDHEQLRADRASFLKRHAPLVAACQRLSLAKSLAAAFGYGSHSHGP
jgi:hypothetical protein